MEKQNPWIRLRSNMRYPERQPGHRAVIREDKLRIAALRGVEIASRVSSQQQEDHEGSFLVQEQRTQRRLEMIGVDSPRITVTRVVESAKGGANRSSFDSLVQRIDTGVTGLLIVGYGSRLARNMPDGLRLVEAAAKEQAIIMIGDRILDPRAPHDRSEILRQILDAELENSLRALHSSDAREELAKDLRFRRRLPAGLVYASPDDPSYRRLADEAGLLDWTEPEQIERHQTNIERNGMQLYVLPDPHPGVFAALQLMTEWLFETENPTEVQRRIASDPRYPRPGLVPRARVWTFNASVPTGWVEPVIGWLRGWLASEALYGIYSYRSVALANYGQDECPHVLVPDAFPSLLRSCDVERVTQIFSNPARMWKQGSYTGPRNHALANVHCAEVLSDESVCGRRAHAVYDSEGRFNYVSGRCRIHDDHQGRFSWHIEALVLDVLKRVFTPERLKGLEEVLCSDLLLRGRREKELEAEVERLAQSMDAAMEFQTEARVKNRVNDVARWAKKAESYGERQHQLEISIRELRAENVAVEGRGAKEVADACRLGGDIPRLLESCADLESRAPKAAEGLRRRLIRLLVRAVHVRPLADTLYEVSVEFPSGARVCGFVGTCRQKPTRHERQYIEHRLSLGDSPEVVAAELTRLRRAFPRLRRDGPERGNWTADAVLSVHYAHESVAPDSTDRDLLPLQLVAARCAERPDAVKGAALGSALGPIHLMADDLLLAPTDEEIERSFPNSAPKRVAKTTGWSEADVTTIAALADELGRSKPYVRTHAARLGALVQTATGRLYACRSILLDHEHKALG